MIQNNNVNYKFLTKQQLVDSLSDVPDGSLISTNNVGNLCVTNSDHRYIGYIDTLTTGSFESNN